MAASWRRNFAHSIDANSSEEVVSGSGESETESFVESDAETGESSECSSAPKQASSKAKRRGRKAVWNESHITDMVDIICSSEYLRKNLIFRNTTRGRNSAIYDQVLKELQERLASRGEHFSLSVSQIRNKFKKCVAECKKAALTIKTATGIKRFQEEKKFGDWFQQLYSFVKTRDSCKPEMALEPSSSSSSSKDKTQQDTETDSEKTNAQESPNESKGGGSPNFQYVPVKRGKKRAKVDPVVEAIETMKQVIQKDPTKDFLEFLKEENERARQHEMRVLQMMMAPQPIATPPPNYTYNHSSSSQYPGHVNRSKSPSFESPNTYQAQNYSTFARYSGPHYEAQNINSSENNYEYFSL